MNETTITFYPKDSGSVSLTCEVAKSIFEKEIGLMHRTSLHANRGMIFPFLFTFHRVFWMRNVKIPLDIIFVGKDMNVRRVFEAPANVGFFNKKFWAFGFCKYVIECNKGFCKIYHIVPGTKVFYSPKNVNTN